MRMTHLSSIETTIGVSLVSIEVLASLVNLDRLELPLDPVPVENPLYPRPTTPLQTPPAGLRRPYSRLGKPRDIKIGTIYPRMPTAIRIGVLKRQRRRRKRSRTEGRSRRLATTSDTGLSTAAAASTGTAAPTIDRALGTHILVRRGRTAGIVRCQTTSTAPSGSTTSTKVPVLEDTGGVGLLKDTVVFRVLF